MTKVFASGHAPCLLALEYHTNGKGAPAPSRIMLKDDDVRSDTMVLVMFEVFNALWLSSGLLLKPELITFRCIPGGTNFGFMEFVENSGPIRDYDFAHIASLTGTSFALRRALMRTDDEMDTFLSTAAAGYIGGFLLGIRDRHEDNLMVKVTLGKCLSGLTKRVRTSTASSSLTSSTPLTTRRSVLTDAALPFRIASRTPLSSADNGATLKVCACRVSYTWLTGADRTMAAYMVLRRNSQIIIQLSRGLFKDLFRTSICACAFLMC